MSEGSHLTNEGLKHIKTGKGEENEETNEGEQIQNIYFHVLNNYLRATHPKKKPAQSLKIMLEQQSMNVVLTLYC